MKLSIIKKREKFFTFSGVLIVIALLSLIAWGLKPGIDFTGGSLMELQFAERPTSQEIKISLQDFDLGDVVVQPSEETKYLIRFKNIDEDTHQSILSKLKEDFKTADTLESENEKEDKKPAVQVLDESGNPAANVSFSATTEDGTKVGNIIEKKEDIVELRFDSIGPTIGAELRNKSYMAMLYVVVAIILFVAWAFRHVSKPIKSWKYGVVAVIALIHDVILTIGVFVFLGHYFAVEINTPFIAALLTILGYSVNDTIVVFDRVRENLRRYHEDFEETVNDSVNETLVRSINTSVTTLFVLGAVFFFGGETIKNFVLALMVGMAVGTYSSIFVASPLLVTWHKLSEKFSKNS